MLRTWLNRTQHFACTRMAAMGKHGLVIRCNSRIMFSLGSALRIVWHKLTCELCIYQVSSWYFKKGCQTLLAYFYLFNLWCPSICRSPLTLLAGQNEDRFGIFVTVVMGDPIFVAVLLLNNRNLLTWAALLVGTSRWFTAGKFSHQSRRNEY